MNLTIPPERISSLCKMQQKHLPRPKVFQMLEVDTCSREKIEVNLQETASKQDLYCYSDVAPSSASQPLLIFRFPHQPPEWNNIDDLPLSVGSGPRWLHVGWVRLCPGGGERLYLGEEIIRPRMEETRVKAAEKRRKKCSILHGCVVVSQMIHTSVGC
jgi:hypothetical protein